MKKPTSAGTRSDIGAAHAALGVTVKSGWACAVLVVSSDAGLRVADSRRVELGDPDVADSRQPYHAGFGTARAAGPHLSKLIAAVRRYGRQSVGTLIRRYRADGHDLAGAGIVVGSLLDPSTIANDHIRIHALEGQLFRGVVEDAAIRHGLPRALWRERDLYPQAVTVLEQTEPALRRTIGGLGRDVEGPWRAEQKAAALAAWLVLAAPRKRLQGMVTDARERKER
jgi:hypothetical protein